MLSIGSGWRKVTLTEPFQGVVNGVEGPGIPSQDEFVIDLLASELGG